jgi:hypothetical protein
MFFRGDQGKRGHHCPLGHWHWQLGDLEDVEKMSKTSSCRASENKMSPLGIPKKTVEVQVSSSVCPQQPLW